MKELNENVEIDLTETTPIIRRVMTLFFIVDVSGSMGGSKIGAVNHAIREVIPILDEISTKNTDSEIKIAMLTFSAGSEWLYDQPKQISDFNFKDFIAGGQTDYGSALNNLNEKLSRRGDGFMKEVTGSFAPAIILLSDGEPTDTWESPLNDLWENRWFKNAIKVAIAIGGDCNKEALVKFTGTPELVIEVHNVPALKTIIKTVTVTSSMIGSQSSTGHKSKSKQVAKTLATNVTNVQGAVINNNTTGNTNSVSDEWD
jgi:uncharacterized protein YegL